MSKKKTKQQNTAAVPATPVAAAAPAIKKTAAFSIPYPLLWLVLSTLAVYFPTFYFKYTELDDSIFIREFSEYNEDLQNLVVSFHRGLFNLKDTYYRPIFLDSMILNYQVSGTDILGYHIVNVLLHVLSVVLLYLLLKKLDVKALPAFILTLVFAVHPVLSQAVAWIPGRNDTLLAIFTLPFLIFSIHYVRSGKLWMLALSGFFLLLAFFTKETAVFAAPVAFVLLVFMLQQKWLDKRMVSQYGVWIACFIIWFIFRSRATTEGNLAIGKLLSEMAYRLPLIVQYTGKIFLPFNLSVLPLQEDTTYYYGIIAIVILAVIIYLNKERNLRLILSSLAVFLLFLIPVLLIPADINKETFEHRLYLPMIGMLLLLSQTVLFKNTLSEKNLLAAGIGVAAILAFLNIRHQKDFTDPHTFWASAVATSPHSSFANMMLGARENDLKKSDTLFRRAYQLDPKQKYLNYYYGVMLQTEDSVLQSEKYLLAEKKISDYVECDFYLAHVALERKDLNAAIGYLESYLKRVPGNKPAHNNLLLLYMQTQQADKAKAEAREMLQHGMEVPQAFRAQLGV